jgi:hypothetical protein
MAVTDLPTPWLQWLQPYPQCIPDDLVAGAAVQLMTEHTLTGGLIGLASAACGQHPLKRANTIAAASICIPSLPKDKW